MAKRHSGRIVEVRRYYGNRLNIKLDTQNPEPKEGFFVLRRDDDDPQAFVVNVATLLMAANNGHIVEFSTGDYERGEVASIGDIRVLFR